MIMTLPFSSKKLPTGEKIFRRKHGYTLTLGASGTTNYIVVCPYTRAKINEAEILWAPEGVTLNMKVKDTDTGAYTTIPNALLSQFGFDVAVASNFYSDFSQYDADVHQNMQLEFEFSNSSNTEKTIGINIVFHEIV